MTWEVSSAASSTRRSQAAASPFGAYDRALIEAVSHRWYSLLDQHAYVSDNRGKVVLQFHLHPDGSITDMNVAETTAAAMSHTATPLELVPLAAAVAL